MSTEVPVRWLTLRFSTMLHAAVAAAAFVAAGALVPPAVVSFDTLSVPALQSLPVPYDPRNVTNATFVFTARLVPVAMISSWVCASGVWGGTHWQAFDSFRSVCGGWG